MKVTMLIRVAGQPHAYEKGVSYNLPPKDAERLISAGQAALVDGEAVPAATPKPAPASRRKAAK